MSEPEKAIDILKKFIVESDKFKEEEERRFKYSALANRFNDDDLSGLYEKVTNKDTHDKSIFESKVNRIVSINRAKMQDFIKNANKGGSNETAEEYY